MHTHGARDPAKRGIEMNKSWTLLPRIVAAVPLIAMLSVPSQEPAGALPFDLAFDRREFLWDAGPAVSPQKMSYARGET